MNTRRTTLAALALTGILTLAGCGSSSSGDTPSGSAPKADSPSTSATPSATPSEAASPEAAAPAVITIKDFEFTTPASVKPGSTVMVKNEDSEAHTVTADGKGGFDVKIDPGATAKLTAPGSAGSFPFHCTYHADMHGTLKVA